MAKLVAVHERSYKGLMPVASLHRTRLRALLGSLSALSSPPESWADFGCSNGFIMQRVLTELQWSPPTLYGFDHSSRLLQQAQAKGIPNANFREFDLNRSHETESLFDLVTCFETLEHTGDCRAAFDNLVRHTKPGGRLVVSVPNEIGLIGLTKFLARPLARRAPYKNFFNDSNAVAYALALVAGRRISSFRMPPRKGWAPHLGFDYRDLLAYVQTNYTAKGQLQPCVIRYVALWTSVLCIWEKPPA
ncbi:MAG: methyltransferase domain-containing protein [Chitinivibrionales bacterium]|nr:methyltransferase domain-containing protein [Chitinivibrionales bacterium]